MKNIEINTILRINAIHFANALIYLENEDANFFYQHISTL